MRVEGVEAAVASGDGLDDALRAELLARRARWLADPANPGVLGRLGLWLLQHISPYLARSVPQLLTILALIYVSVVFPAVGLVLMVLLVVGLVSRAKLVRSNTGLAAALRGCKCPACGYDLRGIDAFDEFDEDGRPVAGPRVCPECGSAWPLVPAGVG